MGDCREDRGGQKEEGGATLTSGAVGGVALPEGKISRTQRKGAESRLCMLPGCLAGESASSELGTKEPVSQMAQSLFHVHLD